MVLGTCIAFLLLPGTAAAAFGPPYTEQHLITDDWDPFGDPSDGKPYTNCSEPYEDPMVPNRWVVDYKNNGYWQKASFTSRQAGIEWVGKHCK